MILLNFAFYKNIICLNPDNENNCLGSMKPYTQQTQTRKLKFYHRKIFLIEQHTVFVCISPVCLNVQIFRHRGNGSYVSRTIGSIPNGLIAKRGITRTSLSLPLLLS